jgi:hypothetical protein
MCLLIYIKNSEAMRQLLNRIQKWWLFGELMTQVATGDHWLKAMILESLSVVTKATIPTTSQGKWLVM